MQSREPYVAQASDTARGFYETKGFFCSFVFQRLSFLHTLFLEHEAQTNKINYGTMFFMSTQVSLPKISLILLQKMSDIRPFCRKPFKQNIIINLYI